MQLGIDYTGAALFCLRRCWVRSGAGPEWNTRDAEACASRKVSAGIVAVELLSASASMYIHVYIDGGGRGLFYEEMSCGSAVSLLFFVGS